MNDRICYCINMMDVGCCIERFSHQRKLLTVITSVASRVQQRLAAASSLIMVNTALQGVHC